MPGMLSHLTDQVEVDLITRKGIVLYTIENLNGITMQLTKSYWK
jgi:hypothetical protein